MNKEKLNLLYIEAKENRIVWKGDGKDKRWKFKTEEGLLIAKTSEEKIRIAYLDYIANTYLKYQKDKITYGILYSEWLDSQRDFIGTESGNKHPSTFRRYQRDYERYIENTIFDNELVSNITAIKIERFFLTMVKKHHLTKRSLTNISGYIKHSILYARKCGLISENPYDLVDISLCKSKCKVIVKQNDDRIISSEDILKLTDTLYLRYKSSKYYIQDYAIELATLTGMRVGELAALKWSSITNKHILIEFSEHRLDYDDKSCIYSIGETKNRKCRKFPLSDDIKSILAKIKLIQEEHAIYDEFVFADKNGRVNSHTISCAMTRRCTDAGIAKKSIHDIRRTVSSQLRTMLPVATVSNMLGHTEETNESYYNYDIKSDDEKISCLNKLYKSKYTHLKSVTKCNQKISNKKRTKTL